MNPVRALGLRLGACASIAWAMAASGDALAGQYAFAQPVHHRDTVPIYARVGDINADGLDDIVALNHDGRAIVRVQKNNGTLGPAQVVQHPVLVRGVAILDIGSNESAVLVIGDEAGFHRYPWNGSGYQAQFQESPVACGLIASGDYDRDGNADVFCSSTDGAAVFYGQGAGGFEPGVVLELPASRGTFAHFEDVNGDDLPDLLIAAPNSNSFFVLDNDGRRGFLPAIAYPYEQGHHLTWSSSLAVGDVDRDGTKEIYAALPCNVPCARVLVFRRNARGYLGLSQQLTTTDIPNHLALEDIDGDGHRDLLVGHPAHLSLGRYMGTADGVRTTEVLTIAPGGSFDLGDVNGDGQVDAVFGSSMGLSVLYGGREQPSDFNGDLVSDLVWRHASGRNVVWLAADSALSMEIPALDPIWSLDAFLTSKSAGHAVAFWRNADTGENVVWSHSHLVLESRATLADTNWQVVGSGDFDGDGGSDLFWRHEKTGANTLWLDGEKSREQVLEPVADVRWQVVAVGDFDGNGVSDVAWRHRATGRLVVWPGADRAQQRALATVNNLAWEVVGVGDFDRNGRDDLVWRQRETGQNLIWLGADATRQQAVRRVSNSQWFIAAVGDYDGDGRSDLLWRHAVTGRNVAWHSADYRLERELTRAAVAGWSIAAP